MFCRHLQRHRKIYNPALIFESATDPRVVCVFLVFIKFLLHIYVIYYCINWKCANVQMRKRLQHMNTRTHENYKYTNRLSAPPSPHRVAAAIL